ncbi:MAG: hypothetical protein CMJ85_07185 [Planctomycetes bacterium]|nr:hypothetical protein [Planctomycetota bacterium]
MLAFLDMFEELNRFSDSAVYLYMALISSTLFMIRLGLMMLFGDFGDDGLDADIDLDVDAPVDTSGHPDSTGAFALFSLLSILAFFMGAGWMGFAARTDWNLSSPLSAFVAIGFGAAMMALAATMMWYVRTKFERIITYDIQTCIGTTGRAYLPIPPGKGLGQAQVVVSGRRKLLSARTDQDEPIESFETVTVVSIDDDGTLVVRSHQ